MEILLFLSIALLFIAPLLTLISQRSTSYVAILNGFVFVVISALIFFHIIPDLIIETGEIVLLFVFLGLLLPWVTEKALHNSNLVHKVSILVAVLGLALHAMMDGMAMSDMHASTHLAYAVAIHRIPMGLLVWWFVKTHFGRFAAYLMLGIIATGTIVGFYFAESLLAPLQATGISYFQAIVAGMLIHVLLHQPHEISESTNQHAEGTGNLLGIVGVILLLEVSDHSSTETNWLHDVASTMTTLSLEIAPILILVFIFVGLIVVFKPGNERKSNHNKYMNAVRYVSHDLQDQLAPWIVLGVFIASFLNSIFQIVQFTDVPVTYSWVEWSSLFLILALLGYSIFRNGMRSLIAELLPHHTHDH